MQRVLTDAGTYTPLLPFLQNRGFVAMAAACHFAAIAWAYA